LFPKGTAILTVFVKLKNREYNKNMENSLERKPSCEIVEPSVELKESFFSALERYKKEGLPFDESIKDLEEDFDTYLKKINDEARGINMQPGRVPQSVYWITDADGYVGRISIRHELNEELLKMGGSIGYGVVPWKRGLGYGTRSLELALPKARALGLKKVLIACNSDNIGSKKIIEANGGVLENEVPAQDGKPAILRYWINL